MHGIRPAEVPPIPCLATEGSQIIFLFFFTLQLRWSIHGPSVAFSPENGNYAALHTAVAFKHVIAITLTHFIVLFTVMFLPCIIMIVLHSSFTVIDSHLLSPCLHILSCYFASCCILWLAPHLRVFVCGDVSQ